LRAIRSLIPALALAVGLSAAGSVSATTISGSAFPNGGSTFTSSLDGGVAINWTLSPEGSYFQKKSGGGITGVGISGNLYDRTPGEIDINEILIGSASGGAFKVDSFTLGLLFDGPEYGDYQEVASISVTLLDNTVLKGTLTNTYQNLLLNPDQATWSRSGATVTNVSPSDLSGGAVWTVANPFGDVAIKRISFTALAGACGAGLTCNNQSDFTFVSMEARAVPEPATLGLLGVALVGVAFAARRRTAR
jgi:hypothetical protein